MSVSRLALILTAIPLATVYSQAGVKNMRTGITYPTVQAALNFALNGDELRVSTGTYAEYISIDADVALLGNYLTDYTTKQGNYGLTVITAAGVPGSINTVEVKSNRKVLLRDLDITGGHGSVSGGGIWCGSSATLTCEHCRIHGNSSAYGGGGVRGQYQNAIVFIDTPIYDNRTAEYGGGIDAYSPVRLVLSGSDTDLEHNYALDGGGVAVRAGQLIMTDSADVQDNVAGRNGGGIFLGDNAAALITDSGTQVGWLTAPNVASNDGGGVYVADSTLTLTNFANVGHGIALHDGGGVFVTNGTLNLARFGSVGLYVAGGDNHAAHDGGGVCLFDSTLYANNAKVRSSHSDYRGGGICARRSTVQFLNGAILGEDDPDLVCRADFPGGGLYAANSSVTFSNAFITGNRAPYYEGAGACFEYHNTVLVFCTEIALNAGGYGGGIYVAGNASGPFLFELVSIVSNTAGYSGGGMSWRSSAPLRMYDSTIRDNRATNDPVIGAHGGGLISLSGDGVLTRTLVTRNAADADGGGIEVQAGTLTLADSSLGYNHADFNANGDGRGGGLYIYDGAANVLASDQGCTFCGNSAHQGGAIAVRYGDTALVIYAPGYHQCVFAHNSAANQGGALYLQYCRARCQGNLLFDANTSVWGGAVCATGSACFVAAPVGNHRPVFTRNIAAMGGGALFLAGTGTGVLTDTTFGLPDAGNHVVTDHYLTRGGGGVAACEGSLIDAVNCRFFHNSSVTIGGALGLLNSRLVLRGQFDEPGAGVLPPNLFFGNTAKSRGAAVSLVSSTENLIADAAFISNRSTASSILDQYHADALIYNSLMVHNSATNTGAALVEFLFSSTGTFVNCTIADNLNSGITSHDGQNRIVLTNCIVWGHPGAQVEAGHSVCYSDVQGGYPTGPGNISSNPLFASAAALDYRLTYGSPCINAGFPCAWLTNDCSGEKRPQLGTWAWDMGAYEFIPEPVAAMAACALLWSLRTRAAITGTQ